MSCKRLRIQLNSRRAGQLGVRSRPSCGAGKLRRARESAPRQQARTLSRRCHSAFASSPRVRLRFAPRHAQLVARLQPLGRSWAERLARQAFWQQADVRSGAAFGSAVLRAVGHGRR